MRLHKTSIKSQLSDGFSDRFSPFIATAGIAPCRRLLAALPRLGWSGLRQRASSRFQEGLGCRSSGGMHWEMAWFFVGLLVGENQVNIMEIMETSVENHGKIMWTSWKVMEKIIEDSRNEAFKNAGGNHRWHRKGWLFSPPFDDGRLLSNEHVDLESQVLVEIHG